MKRVDGAMTRLRRFAGRLSPFGWRPLVRDDAALRAILSELCAAHQQPAMAAALVFQGATLASATAGVLCRGSTRPVEHESRFHLGSTTKTLTALLVAQLVAEGALRWDTTLGQALEDLGMHDDYRRVSVRQLLLNRSGVIAMQDSTKEDPGVSEALWQRIPAELSDGTAQRTEVARLALRRAPLFTPGTRSVYSNVGWSILGLVAERAAGRSFEELLRARVFDPLGMAGARVGGWPASVKEPDQPRGHHVGPAGAAARPQALDDPYVFPAWMNPSGGVHCTIADAAAYVLDQLRGLRGEGRLLGRDGYATLHAVQDTVDVAASYASGEDQLQEIYGGGPLQGQQPVGYGWAVAPQEEGTVSICDGSGGTFFARLVVFPALDVAFAGMTSAGNGARALDEAIERVSGFQWRS